jgi:hypothetical protein
MKRVPFIDGGRAGEAEVFSSLFVLFFVLFLCFGLAWLYRLLLFHRLLFICRPFMRICGCGLWVGDRNAQCRCPNCSRTDGFLQLVGFRPNNILVHLCEKGRRGGKPDDESSLMSILAPKSWTRKTQGVKHKFLPYDERLKGGRRVLRKVE